MASQDAGSITRWIDDLKAGDPAAARPLWERCSKAWFAWPVPASARHRARAADEEDVALSAFDSFYAAAACGRFPRLDDRDDLWRILVTVTERKAIDLVRRQRRLKRGGGRERNEADLDGLGLNPIDQVAGAAPTPEFAALVAEEYRLLLDALEDDLLRRIAVLKMEGYTNREIADLLKIGLRSVVRKLALICKAWLAECPR